ncbi:Uncharacterized protein C05D11.1 [Babesia sp. Xinjiang]|uniref:Uncharacterized protein C05D11.1 n=1 Tax=Babesia sp. Xinjiang TaxID=462227 RepID=UPI000A23AB45|nr:Uncharacterized protein C05D11.1 [Babesia sp. Xinjiang]ORM39500.1 Uncharacterized protein C05D11.1 [Babesia sp. Xinjiang]
MVSNGVSLAAGAVLGEMIAEFMLVNMVTLKHVEVLEYVSSRSGMRVFLMEYESPIVNSYYIFPTRAENHEGLPHTLEHLIFLGSALYPERGTLDLLASRAIATGTNAWTDVDHTVYTISTAGLEGSLKMMPVYLDHLLRPTLTQDAFITDVHRVTPDGMNSGTVYCEMKNHENSADSITNFELMHLLYLSESGYSMVHGGRLEALRRTTNERVREYHRRYYRLDNMSIALGGRLGDRAAILKAVAHAEAGLISSGVETHPVDAANYFGIKHWDDPVHCPPLDETSHSTVYFPSDDEEVGQFTMAWRGPKWDEFELCRAISLLGLYLTHTPISPMEQALVYTKDPFGSGVVFSHEILKDGHFTINVQDVPCNPSKLDTIESRIRELLLEVFDNPLDMQRLRALILRECMAHYRSLETSPAEVLVDGVISYVIYGSDRKDLDEQLEGNGQMSSLLEKDEEYWKGILWQYFIDAPWVTVTTLPSIEESERIERFEQSLISQQLEASDLDFLREQEERVELIFSNKSGSVPPHVMEAFGLVDVSKIQPTAWPYMRNFTSIGYGHDGGRVLQGRVQLFNEHGGSIPVSNWSSLVSDLYSLHILMQVNHIASDFVRISVVIPTSHLGLSHMEKQSLTLLCALLFQSDFGEGLGPSMPADILIRQLQEYTSSYSANLGFNSTFGNPDGFCELIQLSMTCHLSNYERVFYLLQRVLRDVRFTPTIISSRVSSLLKSFKKKGRSAKSIVRQASQAMRLRRDSALMSNGLGQQLEYLHYAEESDMTELLQGLYYKLFSQGNMVAHVTCDLTQMPDSWLRGWSVFSGSDAMDRTLRELMGLRSGADAQPNDVNGVFMSMASTDVSFLSFVIPAPLGHLHPEYALLCVLSEYLCMMESPLFRAIRGGGFAYNYSVSYSPNLGELHLSLQQAVDVLGALRATREVFAQMATGHLLTDSDVLSACCSLIYSIIEDEETLSEYSYQTFQDAFRGVGSDFTATLLTQVRQVGVYDLRVLSQKYLTEYLSFGGSHRTIAVVTNKSQADEVHTGLSKMGYGTLFRTTARNLLGFASRGVFQELDLYNSDGSESDDDDELMDTDIDNSDADMDSSEHDGSD